MSANLDNDTETAPMLTPSEVLEHVYCPRFTWFMNVQQIPQHEDKRYKVLKGREVHERREKDNKSYLRRKIGAVERAISVYLASARLRMRGVVDEVLWLEDGTMAPLDYKYTPVRDEVFKTHRIQIIMYGMLIQEAYEKDVNKGFVAYIRGGNKLLEVAMTKQDTNQVEQMIDEIFTIIATGKLPKRTPYRNRCTDCCYKNICV